ncbi:hypothetical protein [Actinomyces bouchesdurhonensis]|uniref:hypothetical protein n=1 Tax=Actinomyces bouchesdurhonensis TaxID=1852361 RepID=UPI0028ECCC3C|nr:hypothetical protein [Actinomyces bouchesdurhonensis]
MTVITLAVIYLIKKTAAMRYALAGVSVIILFVAFPIFAACLEQNYVYLAFIGRSVELVEFAIRNGDELPTIIIVVLAFLLTLTWLLCAIGLLRPDKAPRSMAMPTPLNAPIPYGALIAPSSVSGIVANTGPITGPGVSQYMHGQVSHTPVNMQYGYGYATSPAAPNDRRKSRRLSLRSQLCCAAIIVAVIALTVDAFLPDSHVSDFFRDNPDPFTHSPLLVFLLCYFVTMIVVGIFLLLRSNGARRAVSVTTLFLQIVVIPVTESFTTRDFPNLVFSLFNLSGQGGHIVIYWALNCVWILAAIFLQIPDWPATASATAATAGVPPILAFPQPAPVGWAAQPAPIQNATGPLFQEAPTATATSHTQEPPPRSDQMPPQPSGRVPATNEEQLPPPPQ